MLVLHYERLKNLNKLELQLNYFVSYRHWMKLPGSRCCRHDRQNELRSSLGIWMFENIGINFIKREKN